MQLINKDIGLIELTTMSEKMFGNLVKAVVDIEQNLICIDADFHADQEQFLLDTYGSNQEHLWGINLHPTKWGTPQFIEFDSMINLRPSMGNLSRGVDSPTIRSLITKLIIGKVKV